MIKGKREGNAYQMLEFCSKEWKKQIQQKQESTCCDAVFFHFKFLIGVSKNNSKTKILPDKEEVSDYFCDRVEVNC